MQNGLSATLAGLAKPVIIRVSGEQRYLRLRRSGLKALRTVNRRRGQIQRRRSEKNGFALTQEIGRHGDLLHVLVDTMSPPQAAQENFDFVADALDARDIEWWLVEDYAGHGYRIGVRDELKPLVASALIQPRPASPIYVKSQQSTAVALAEVEGLCARCRRQKHHRRLAEEGQGHQLGIRIPVRLHNRILDEDCYGIASDHRSTC